MICLSIKFNKNNKFKKEIGKRIYFCNRNISCFQCIFNISNEYGIY